MTEELKACPFCGLATAELFRSEFPAQGVIWTVFCNACEAEGPHRSTPEIAIVAWNTHAHPSKITQLVKAARTLADQDTMLNYGTLALVNASELAALRDALASFKEVE